MKNIYLISIIILLFLSACSDEIKNNVQVQKKIELEPIVITDYSEQTELFVEFDKFIINQPSTFLAHFTYMDTFKPFNKGRVKACLTFENKTKECFSVEAPAFEGIFKPVAIPTQSGNAKLDISIELGDINVTHALGSFMVYNSQKQIPTSVEEEDNGISYLKEQQWKVEFATEIVKQRLLRESISTFAKIEIPHNKEYVLTAPVSGIISLNDDVNIGMQVKKNMVLAYISPLLGQKEDMSTLKFEHKKAQANLNMTKSENERTQKLKAKNAVSQKRLIMAKQNYEIAKAKLANINQRLSLINTNNNKELGLALKNTLDGEISKLLVLPGSYVNEGEPIMSIVNTDKLWVNINIPQSETSKINNPLGVELSINDSSLVFIKEENTKFIYFNNRIDPKTRCASLLFEIDNVASSLNVGAGYAAKAYTGKILKTLAIPKSSIVNDNGQHVVYVQVGGESFERRNVKTGLSDSDYIQVHSGVSEGEHVVSKGAYQVLLSVVSPAAAGAGHAH